MKLSLGLVWVGEKALQTGPVLACQITLHAEAKKSDLGIWILDCTTCACVFLKSAQWLLEFRLFSIYYSGFSKLLLTYVNISIIYYQFHVNRVFIYMYQLIELPICALLLRNCNNNKTFRKLMKNLQVIHLCGRKQNHFLKWSHKRKNKTNKKKQVT